MSPRKVRWQTRPPLPIANFGSTSRPSRNRARPKKQQKKLQDIRLFKSAARIIACWSSKFFQANAAALVASANLQPPAAFFAARCQKLSP